MNRIYRIVWNHHTQNALDQGCLSTSIRTNQSNAFTFITGYAYIFQHLQLPELLIYIICNDHINTCFM